jgi:hypothetical protein
VHSPALTPCHRPALYALIRSQGRLADQTSGPVKTQWQIKALANLRRLIQGGPLPAWVYEEMTTYAIEAGNPALALFLVADWQQRHPSDPRLARARAAAVTALGGPRPPVAPGNGGSPSPRPTTPVDPRPANSRSESRIQPRALASEQSAFYTPFPEPRKNATKTSPEKGPQK